MTNKTQTLVSVDEVKQRIEAALASRTGTCTHHLQDFSKKFSTNFKHVRELDSDDLGASLWLYDRDIVRQSVKDYKEQKSWGKQEGASLHWSVLWAAQVNRFDTVPVLEKLMDTKEDVQPPVSIEAIQDAANKMKELCCEYGTEEVDDENRDSIILEELEGIAAHSKLALSESPFIMLQIFRDELAKSTAVSFLSEFSDAEILSMCTWDLLHLTTQETMPSSEGVNLE